MSNKPPPAPKVVPEVSKDDISRMFILLCQQYDQMGKQLATLSQMLSVYMEKGVVIARPC